jgi:uncharacterized repeat protein (TIGR01451 family)
VGAQSKVARFRRVRSIATVGFLIAAGLVWSAGPAQAVHDNGMFELDGNTTHNSGTTPPYDWNSLFDASGNRIVTPDPDNGPVLASTFVNDTALPDQSYFTSNKDIQPIKNSVQHWGCDPINNPLAKDNLLNAYAALVQVPANAADNAGHQVLYLGSERGSNNGTSFAGFWLLKDKSVGCSGSNNFSGQHTDGDLLIVSDYTNGGGTQDVTVYRWTGNDASGAPVLQGTFNGSICSNSLSNDNACAIANASTITTPWSPNSHDSNTFVETGIDMTALLGQAGGCFTTFLAETRSSNQLTATLKDFAGGQFDTCVPPPIDTTATPGGSLNPVGVSTQHDVATISAVGNRPAPTGTISFFLCNPAQVTAGGCVSGGTAVGGAVPIVAGAASSVNASGSLTQTTGKYCWRAEYTPDTAATSFYVSSSHTNSTTECFTVVHASPTITTQIAVTGDNSPGLGFTTLGDTATLHNFVGTVTGETVTFKLYDVTADPGCTGSVVFQTTGSLSASGEATTSATYAPTEAHKYTWIASYPGDTLNDSATGTCSDNNESSTIVGATIDVAKSANPPGPVSAGQSIGFDITVSNSGAVPATGVTVSDNLPAKADGAGSGDLNWSLNPAYSGCSITGAVGSQVLTCNLGTVAGNLTLPVIHVESTTSSADCGVVSNKASVATTNGTGGDSDLAHVTILCPSLSFTKQADAATVSAGSTIGFTVTASNAGPGSAFAVTISDPLPAGSGVDWSIASQTSNACSITGSVGSEVLSCTIGTLAAAASYTVHITSGTAFASCKAYPNTATLAATNASSLIASDTTTVLCPTLDITKTADADAVNAGTQIGFVVTASNDGPGDATGVTINDPLPAGSGVDWSIASQDGSACSITGAVGSQVLACSIATLGGDSTYTVHVVSDTAFASCKAYPNTATLHSTNGGGDQTASDTTTVLCAALLIHKAADAESVNVGSDIGFTVTIANDGAGVASGTDVEDPLPAGPGIDWQIDSANTTGPLTCSIDGVAPSQVLKCTGTLAAKGDAGDTEAVHITSTTQWTKDGETEINSCTGGTDGTGVYDNTANVTWSFGPALPISSNEASEAVLCPDLTFTKAADADFVSAGDQIGFTVELTNANTPTTGSAVGATIHDPLPAGTTVDWTIDSVTGTDAANCAITGAIGAQVLDCDLGMVIPGADIAVHIVSDTTQADCVGYDNTAHLLTVNVPGGDASDSTAVRCPNINLEKTADAPAVNDGDPIGFTLTVTNANNPDTGTGHDVALHDALPGGPAGSDVVWTIDPAYDGPGTCEITGDQGNQVLDCHFGNLAPNATVSVHLMSNTSFVSCGDYPNTATESASNDADHNASATVSVICPVLDNIVVVADDPGVPANKPIGFTLSGQNDAEHLTTDVTTGTAKTVAAVHKLVAPLLASSVEPGTVVNAVLASALPTGTGIHWSIAPDYSGPGSCAIAGPDGTQILTCQLGNLAPQEGFSVHIVSDTVCESGGAYLDKGTLSSANVPEVSSQDTTRVLACAIVIQRPPPPPVASTGTPLLGLQLTWGIALVTLGGFVVLVARRRRRGPAEAE